ncbi:hypothetical protein C8R45DRAFT_1224506 [Mycena sanguinolenta]|nr:hypothetical protein C8R45DRAFT_1224506 [Mycena sanguinolenta]
MGPARIRLRPNVRAGARRSSTYRIPDLSGLARFRSSLCTRIETRSSLSRSLHSRRSPPPANAHVLPRAQPEIALSVSGTARLGRSRCTRVYSDPTHARTQRARARPGRECLPLWPSTWTSCAALPRYGDPGDRVQIHGGRVRVGRARGLKIEGGSLLLDSGTAAIALLVKMSTDSKLHLISSVDSWDLPQLQDALNPVEVPHSMVRLLPRLRYQRHRHPRFSTPQSSDEALVADAAPVEWPPLCAAPLTFPIQLTRNNLCNLHTRPASSSFGASIMQIDNCYPSLDPACLVAPCLCGPVLLDVLSQGFLELDQAAAPLLENKRRTEKFVRGKSNFKPPVKGIQHPFLFDIVGVKVEIVGRFIVGKIHGERIRQMFQEFRKMSKACVKFPRDLFNL